jgi:hypothetical protein
VTEQQILLALRAPDAVIWKKTPIGKLTDQGRETAVETAERLLQIDPLSLELAWVRDQVSYYFATRDPTDTEFYAEGHHRSHQPRYVWADQGDGSKLGWRVS